MNFHFGMTFQSSAVCRKLSFKLFLFPQQHSDEVKKLLERLSMLQKDLNEAQALASSAAEATEEIKEKCKKSQKKLECAVKAQSLLGNVESMLCFYCYPMCCSVRTIVCCLHRNCFACPKHLCLFIGYKVFARTLTNWQEKFTAGLYASVHHIAYLAS